MNEMDRERTQAETEPPPGAPSKPPEDVDTDAPVSTNEKGEGEDLPDLHGEID